VASVTMREPREPRCCKIGHQFPFASYDVNS